MMNIRAVIQTMSGCPLFLTRNRSPDTFDEEFVVWKNKKILVRETGRRLCVSHKTFLKWAKELSNG